MRALDDLRSLTETELAMEYEAAFETAKRAIALNDQPSITRMLHYCDRILCLRLQHEDQRLAPFSLD
jgi:hypothetical protein